jgi:hypothetical protein
VSVTALLPRCRARASQGGWQRIQGSPSKTVEEGSTRASGLTASRVRFRVQGSSFDFGCRGSGSSIASDLRKGAGAAGRPGDRGGLRGVTVWQRG